MPLAIEIKKIYPKKREQEVYTRARKSLVGAEYVELIYEESEVFNFSKFFKSLVPAWILELGKEFEDDGVTLEQALEESRRISRKFKTPLSEEIITEREERR